MGFSAVAAFAGGALLASSMSKPPNMGSPAAPEKPKQPAKAPDYSAIAGRNAAQNAGGLGSTFLTGSSGVNPASLNLGGNTLLGG